MRERVHEAIKFAVWKCPVDIYASFRRGAIEVVRAENDFESAAPADEMGEAFRTAAGMHSYSDVGLPQSRLLARCETHSQARTNSLLAPQTLLESSRS